MSGGSSSSWNSWFQSQKEAVTNALDKTGDVISKVATSAAHKQKTTAGSTEAANNNNNNNNNNDGEDQQQQQQQQTLTTDASLTSPSTHNNNSNNNLFSSLTHLIDHTRVVMEQEQSKLLNSLSAFTNTSTTPASLLHQRPVHWPLDVDALRDMEVVYITNRIITCSHPYLDSAIDPTITAERKLQALSHLLHQRHDPNKYMIWNLSEVNNYSTDTSLSLLHFNDQVLTFSFPGSPSPPLGLLLKLVVSMESWLQAEPDHVIVVHCLTGRGRSSLAVAALLCWTGEAQFTTSVPMALDYIAQCKQIQPTTTTNTTTNQNHNHEANATNAAADTTTTTTNTKEEDELTIPSQRRYGTYFTNMMEGIRPFQPPLILKRIILSQAPKFSRGPQRPSTATERTPDHQGGTMAILPNEEEDATDVTNDGDALVASSSSAASRMGCAPYLQIFKGGQLIFTTTPSVHSQQQQQQQQQQQGSSAGQQQQQQQQQSQTQMLPFCSMADGPISFLVDIIVQGDVLIRCRHVTPQKSRVSMFRAAFHTGYVPTPILRLKKSELDGACHDRRFADDFYVDVIFEPVQAETASQHLMMMQAKSNPGEDATTNDENEEDEDAGAGTVGHTNQDSTPNETNSEVTSDAATHPTGPMESQNEARERRERATLSGFAAAAAVRGKKKGRGSGSHASATVTATAYDSMLHRDSRFWEVIAAKREKRLQQQQQQQQQSGSGDDTVEKEQQEHDLKFWGPTIGRRRDFSQPNQTTNAASADGRSNQGSTATSADASAFLSTPFSIGGEFDFLPSSSPVRNKAKSPNSAKEGPKVDSLMDALNALEDDDDALLFPADSSGDNKEDMEEIVFETGDVVVEPASTKTISNTPPEMNATPTIVSIPPVEDGSSTEKKGSADAGMELTSMTNSNAAPASVPSETASMNDLLKDDTDVDAMLTTDDIEEGGDLIDLDGIDDDDDDDDLEDLEKMLAQN